MYSNEDDRLLRIKLLGYVGSSMSDKGARGDAEGRKGVCIYSLLQE